MTQLWKDIGWSSIVYLASISGVNPELYEAAIIDGAGRFKQVLHVTIPSIMPVIAIMFILAVGRMLFDNFDQIFNLYNPAVYSTGDVISTYTYRTGLVQMQYSLATAVGLFRNLTGLVLIMITNYITSKFTEYGVW
jgi:putative aldouronate transport system permease protein